MTRHDGEISNVRDKAAASPLREHQKQTLVRVLAEAQRPCTSAELAAVLGLPDGRTVAWHLRDLAAEGRVATALVGKLRVYATKGGVHA